MNFPVKQMVLKRIVGLKKSPFVRPYLKGFINADTVTVVDMIIDRSKVDSFFALQSCYHYVQVASMTGDVRTDELRKLVDRLVYKDWNCTMDCGANEGLLSILAVSYSGSIALRKQKALPEGSNMMQRLLFNGRRFVQGYKDESGQTVVNMEEGYRAFRKAAAMGSPEAKYEMGVAYHYGIRCEQDSMKAKRFLKAAANSADARWSCAAMEFALLNEIDIDVNN